jgi:hypothetical protein
VADGGSVAFGRTDPGTPLTQTFTVRNAGTATAALNLGAISLPAGFSLAAGFGQATLAPGQSTTFAIRLDAAAVGAFGGAASFATNDPAHANFTLALTGTASVISYQGDSGAGFSVTPGWQFDGAAGWHSGLYFKQAGSGSEAATWTFSGLAPGVYRVSVTWVPAANRAPNAAYTVLDGSTTLATTLVDQRQAPASLQDAGALWQDLGGPFTVSSGTLTVQLSDLAAAGTYLIADSVRIERIG